jgi:MFS superfamily sulfate permease-like transporter
MISSNREPVRALVVEATAVSQTDTDGADIVIQVIQVAEDLRSRGISLVLAHLEPSILDLWTRAGAIDAVRPDHSFGTVRSAVRHSTPLQPRPSRRPLLHDARRPQVSSWIGAPFPVSRGAGR